MDNCICLVCEKKFTPNQFWRHSTGLCSEECRILKRRETRNKYNKTEKGIIAKERWIKSERRKKNEKGYREKPRARALAVESVNRYRKAHPEKEIYRKRSSTIYMSRTQGRMRKWWADKLEEQGGHCLMCEATEKLTVDHIIPMSKGGTDDIDNLQILCRACNSFKWNKMPSEILTLQTV